MNYYKNDENSSEISTEYQYCEETTYAFPIAFNQKLVAIYFAEKKY